MHLGSGQGIYPEQVLDSGGLLDIVRGVDEQVVSGRIFHNPGYTGEPIETGPDHIHGDDSFFYDQIVEQFGEFLTLDFSCFPHNLKPLVCILVTTS